MYSCISEFSSSCSSEKNCNGSSGAASLSIVILLSSTTAQYCTTTRSSLAPDNIHNFYHFVQEYNTILYYTILNNMRIYCKSRKPRPGIRIQFAAIA